MSLLTLMLWEWLRVHHFVWKPSHTAARSSTHLSVPACEYGPESRTSRWPMGYTGLSTNAPDRHVNSMLIHVFTYCNTQISRWYFSSPLFVNLSHSVPYFSLKTPAPRRWIRPTSLTRTFGGKAGLKPVQVRYHAYAYPCKHLVW